MNRKSLITIMILLMGFATVCFSQPTGIEANEALTKAKEAEDAGNFSAAIQAYEEFITICMEIGEEADAQRIQAELKLPVLHYNLALKSYQDKETKNAIEQFNNTIKVAEKYNDENVKTKTINVLAKIYYQIGGSKYKNEDHQGAIAEFEKSLEYNPEYISSQYMLVVVYKKLDDDEGVKTSSDKAIEMANKQKDVETLNKVTKAARDHFLGKGNDAKKAGNNDKAIHYLKESLNYDESNASAYYLLALIYNEKSDWDNAIENANKAIENESEETEKAKMFFEIGKAAKGKEDTTGACEAFKKAAVGNYAESAKYEMQQLKCN